MFNKVFKKAKENEMINTSFYSGIGTAIGYISGFVVNKVIAVFIGPSGVALVSQFQNFIGISTSVAAGGIQQGVVKYVAEVRENEQEKALALSTSLQITILSTLLVGITSVVISDFLSGYLFGTQEYSLILKIFGATIVLFGLNKLLISILNGTGEIKKLVAVKISTSLFGLTITAFLTYYYGLYGALISLAISQSVVFFISLAFVLRSPWFKKDLFTKKFDNGYAVKFLKYSLMAVSSMVIPPMVQIGIRNYIIENLSIESAGYWDATFKVSTAYLGIITTTLSIYYLPKLSSLIKKEDIRNELINGYKIIIPALLVILLSVFVLRDFIIILLYSKEFIEMKELFPGQLLGDFFKISSWLVAYLMLAKAKTKIFIVTQLVFSAITYLLSIYLINEIGIQGVVWAYAIKYFIYLVVVMIIFREYLVK